MPLERKLHGAILEVSWISYAICSAGTQTTTAIAYKGSDGHSGLENLMSRCNSNASDSYSFDDVLGYYVACLRVSLTEECNFVETDVVTSCLMKSTSSTTGLRLTLFASELFMLKGYKMQLVMWEHIFTRL